MGVAAMFARRSEKQRLARRWARRSQSSSWYVHMKMALLAALAVLLAAHSHETSGVAFGALANQGGKHRYPLQRNMEPRRLRRLTSMRSLQKAREKEEDDMVELPVQSMRKATRRQDDMDGILDELEDSAMTNELERGPRVKKEDPWAWLKDTITSYLVADVFVIFFLFAWFATGGILAQFFGFDGLLGAFMMGWDPYFQAVLGVLFAARAGAYIISFILERTEKDTVEDDDDYSWLYDKSSGGDAKRKS
eukprot:TRINITY_DN118174_c0_g1_i1.p1 TRINITY_DN118174_c0_g1~~TRINITY_DN118174_c0_g1_i1.p1  ORF type:complete len:250 (-),score=39.54 TRINITY_DN118174_c0_g1_i1:130-879(-)